MLEIIFVSFLKRNWSQISKFPRCCISAFLRAPRNNGMLIGQREREREREQRSREGEREESSERASREVGESGPRPEGVPTWIFRDFPSTESSDLDPCRRATVGLGGFEQVPSDTEKQAWILPLHSVIL